MKKHTILLLLIILIFTGKIKALYYHIEFKNNEFTTFILFLAEMLKSGLESRCNVYFTIPVGVESEIRSISDFTVNLLESGGVRAYTYIKGAFYDLNGVNLFSKFSKRSVLYIDDHKYCAQLNIKEEELIKNNKIYEKDKLEAFLRKIINDPALYIYLKFLKNPTELSIFFNLLKDNQDLFDGVIYDSSVDEKGEEFLALLPSKITNMKSYSGDKLKKFKMAGSSALFTSESDIETISKYIDDGSIKDVAKLSINPKFAPILFAVPKLKELAAFHNIEFPLDLETKMSERLREILHNFDITTNLIYSSNLVNLAEVSKESDIPFLDALSEIGKLEVLPHNSDSSDIKSRDRPLVTASIKINKPFLDSFMHLVIITCGFGCLALLTLFISIYKRKTRVEDSEESASSTTFETSK